jgi:colanic acid/amylovoran biosynthesis glycosyltransferase
MRIAYLCGRYPAISNTFIMREVQALRARGFEVDTLTMRRALPEHLLTDLDREERDRTYAVLPPRPADFVAAHAAAIASSPTGYLTTLLTALRLSPAGMRGKLWQLFYFVESLVVWWRCRVSEAGHIHAHFGNVAPDVALLAAHFGKRARSGPRSWSFTMHGPFEFYDVSRHRLGEKAERADLVVCISDFARSQLMGLVAEEHWSKLRVVHCGVDPARFAAQRRDGSEEAEVSLLTVGRLAPVKGQAVLLEAVRQLRAEGVPAHLTLIGDGPKRGDLERLAGELEVSDAVTFAGAVGQDEILRYYARADVFCLASFGEGVPVVLMEAMAVGLPVVTTRIMGVPELVEDGVTGVLVPPGRADSLAGAVKRLAEAPDLRARLGQAGREKVAGDFNLHRSAEQLDELFRELLSSPDGSGTRV